MIGHESLQILYIVETVALYAAIILLTVFIRRRRSVYARAIRVWGHYLTLSLISAIFLTFYLKGNELLNIFLLLLHIMAVIITWLFAIKLWI
ncbi:MAG: hypothetical protein DRJ51_04970 [Thermoprotei archaeon]|nr:MAG: hypothetical protein DRJ51_04970 [Thermoprotei archaeon]RLF02847.1 MAG: hypothetical protein DRJ59_02395 [Thermoprotei archaeon]